MKIYPERKHQLEDGIVFRQCMKKPIPVGAAQINEAFQVETLEGNYKQGKPGDYLMCGVDDELYICDKDIFKRSYDFID